MADEELSHIRSSLINYANRTNRLVDDLEDITKHNDGKDLNYQQEAVKTKEHIKELQKQVLGINQEIKDVEIKMKNTISSLKHLARDTDMNSLKSQMNELNFENLASREYIVKTVREELARTD